MPLLETLTAIVEPWKTMYGDSKVISTAVTSVHLGSLLVAGGLALSADWATLRVRPNDASDRRRHLEELGSTHRPVLIALTILFVSGLALTAADLETFVSSKVYWIKFGAIVLLLLNGLWMTRSENVLRASSAAGQEGRATRHWQALRIASISSLALWMSTLVLGVALVNAA